jgi:tripartite-type tricarboxylate transporter receptor subunit TctC
MIRPIISIALSLLAGLAAAQGFPARPVTLIVPFPPGGSTDTTARIVGERMRAPLGQTVVIENVGGAGGSIIYPLNYDLQKDFEPIGLLSVNAQLMIARKGFPADDLKSLVAYMKANPGKATFVDQNAAARVTGILMQQATNTQVLFVPYRGAGPAMQDMLAQQVDLMVVQAAVTLPQARAGAVKILANLSPARSAVIPNVPTSAESGIPGLYASGWFGLFAPKGTPKEVIARLNAAMVQALADPAVKARLADLGLDMATREQQSPEGLAAFHKAEIEKWWPIIKAAGIKVE